MLREPGIKWHSTKEPLFWWFNADNYLQGCKPLWLRLPPWTPPKLLGLAQGIPPLYSLCPSLLSVTWHPQAPAMSDTHPCHMLFMHSGQLLCSRARHLETFWPLTDVISWKRLGRGPAHPFCSDLCHPMPKPAGWVIGVRATLGGPTQAAPPHDEI